MKLVIKVGKQSLNNQAFISSFAQALRELVIDGRHQVVVVHPETEAVIPAPALSSSGSPEKSECTGVVARRQTMSNKLVPVLTQARVPALGLSGADAGLCTTRFKNHSNGSRSQCIEVVRCDPFWLELISRNGAVPVLVSLAQSPRYEICAVNADEMAAACAIGWNADALIILTTSAGVRQADGSVVRWLDIRSVGSSYKMDLSPQMLSKLNACRNALQHGVRRVRLLPWKEVHHLPSFYVSRINSGTEIILPPDGPIHHQGYRYQVPL